MNFLKTHLNIQFFCLTIIFMLFEGGGYLGIGGYYAPAIILTITASFLTAFRYGITFRQEHFFITILFLIMLFHLNSSIEYMDSSRLIWGFLLLFIMFFALTLYKPQIQDLKIIKYSFLLSAFIISSFILLAREEYGGSGRYTLDIFGPTDPNHLASFLTLGFIFSIKEVFYSLKGIKKIFCIFASIIILTAILFTGSRGAFVSILFAAPILFLITPKKMFIGLFLTAVIFIFSFILLPEDLTNRFIKDSYNDESNKTRIMLWDRSIEKISERPLLGYGAVRSRNITGVGAAHNTFLAFALHFGIIGLLMIILILWKIFRNCLNKDMFLFLALFVNLMINSIILENTNTMPFWFTLIFLTFAVNYKTDNPKIYLWNNI